MGPRKGVCLRKEVSPRKRVGLRKGVRSHERLVQMIVEAEESLNLKACHLHARAPGKLMAELRTNQETREPGTGTLG